LYSWRIETSVIDESNIPNLYSNISFWVVGLEWGHPKSTIVASIDHAST
jgi:hypothetical protein